MINLRLAIPYTDGTVCRSLRTRGYTIDTDTLTVTDEFRAIRSDNYIDRAIDSFLDGDVDIYADDNGVLYAADYDYSTEPAVLAIYARVDTDDMERYTFGKALVKVPADVPDGTRIYISETHGIFRSWIKSSFGWSETDTPCDPGCQTYDFIVDFAGTDVYEV